MEDNDLTFPHTEAYMKAFMDHYKEEQNLKSVQQIDNVPPPKIKYPVCHYLKTQKPIRKAVVSAIVGSPKNKRNSGVKER